MLSQPQFATHLPLPLLYSGSSPEGRRVRANNRTYSKVVIQTFTLLFILVYCVLLSLHLCQNPAYFWTLKTTRVWFVWCHSMQASMCGNLTLCLSLRGLTSSTPMCDKDGPGDAASAFRASVYPAGTDTHTASVSNTVSALEVLCVPFLNTNTWWLNQWWQCRMISVNKWDHCKHLSDTIGIFNAFFY